MADISPVPLRSSPSAEVSGVEEQLTSGTIAHPPRRAITKTNHSQASNGHISQPYHGQMPHNTWNQGFPQPYVFPPNVNPTIGYRQPYGHNGYNQAQFAVAPQHTYSPTPYRTFDQPAYARQGGQNSATKSENGKNIRFIRPALSPEADHEQFAFPEDVVDGATGDVVAKSTATSDVVGDLATELAKSLTASSSIPTTPNSVWSQVAPANISTELEDSDSDAEDSLSHPNKFPVEIEYHDNKYCLYKRQPTRSGLKVKHIKSSVYDPMTSESRNQQQQIKYYQKDLVRICRCGNYTQMDGALVHGRANDCDGYEIHYSQKCKWKAYDDYKTGKRVLIRLCKCYKPMA